MTASQRRDNTVSLRLDTPASLRLDKWLWQARFCKTRALAQKLIARGQATVNGAQVRKSSAAVRSRDRLTLVLGPVKRSVIVLDLGVRRGPPAEARALYDEPQPPEKLSRDDAALPLRKSVLTRPKGSGRPTKKDRRALEKFFERP